MSVNGNTNYCSVLHVRNILIVKEVFTSVEVYMFKNGPTPHLQVLHVF